MHSLHYLWEAAATACLAIAGTVANEYVPSVGTIAMTVSAINGTVTLWKLCRGKHHADHG
jgi:hypothetical protein